MKLVKIAGTDGKVSALQFQDEDGVVLTTLPIAAVLSVSELEIGHVVLKNDSTSDTVKIAVLSTLLGSDVGLGVSEPLLRALIGEVQASPTANTLLDRLKTIGTAAAAATPAGEAHLGEVGGNRSIVDVTLTLDTSAYASGDVLADTQVITNAMRVNDGTGTLESIVISDEDDNTAAGIDLVFLDANASLGTFNAAPSISDANARSILGIVSIAATDWIDLGGAKVASLQGIGLSVKGATGTKNIYVAAITRGAPTQTANGIRARFGFVRN